MSLLSGTGHRFPPEELQQQSVRIPQGILRNKLALFPDVSLLYQPVRPGMSQFSHSDLGCQPPIRMFHALPQFHALQDHLQFRYLVARPSIRLQGPQDPQYHVLHATTFPALITTPPFRNSTDPGSPPFANWPET